MEDTEVKDTNAAEEPKRLSREELAALIRQQQEETRAFIEQHVREAVARRFAPRREKTHGDYS